MSKVPWHENVARKTNFGIIFQHFILNAFLFPFHRKDLASYQDWVIMADQKRVKQDGMAAVMCIFFSLKQLTHFR